MSSIISGSLNGNQLDDGGKTQYGEKFLAEQASALYDFALGCVIENGGFGYLDAAGKVDTNSPRQAYVQSRMIQVFGLSHFFGDSSAKELVAHGITSLNRDFRDKKSQGYFNSIDLTGAPVMQEKLAYDHMFVLLAATMGVALDVAGSQELFDDIDKVIDSKFWDEKYAMMSNAWSLDFNEINSYRGVNANMHAVEALLAAYDLTKNKKYQERALRISKKVALEFAKPQAWLLPEHFDAQWKVDLEFNSDNVADQFCPYGVTIGHLFEWSRLLLQLQISCTEDGQHEDWIVEAATGLYAAGKKYGWSADGQVGFIYTMDWSAKSVVTARMHWVAAEAVMAAYVLWKMTGDNQYLQDYDLWWQYISDHVIDRVQGSWHHELDSKLQPQSGTWAGKPDAYHAFNACLLPLLPLGASFLGSALTTSKNN